jgi:hypothetical protein
MTFRKINIGPDATGALASTATALPDEQQQANARKRGDLQATTLSLVWPLAHQTAQWAFGEI